MNGLQARFAGAGCRGDRGAMSLSLAMVFPAVLLLVLLIVQGSLVWYDQQVAESAAREGAEAGRAYKAGTGPDTGAGDRAATSFLDRIGGTGQNRDVRVTADGDQMVARVSFTTRSLVPLWGGYRVHAEVRLPIEKFVPVVNP